MGNSILCIDDNIDSSNLIKFVFEQSNYEVTTCISSDEGMRLAKWKNFDAIITDYKLDGMTGIELCRQIRVFNQNSPIIFLTGEARDFIKQSALQAGAQAYIIKPANVEKLKTTVIQLIENSSNPQMIQ